MKRTITVKIVQFGGVRTIELPEGSKVIVLRKYIRKRQEDAFYRNGKKLRLNSTLNNGDVIIYAFSIRGAVDFKRHGRKWRIYKNDKDKLFPSNFHAVDIQTGDKLDLYNGCLYMFDGKNLKGKLHKKEYISILIDFSKSKEVMISERAKIILSNMKLKNL